MKKTITPLFAVLLMASCKTTNVPAAASKHREAPETEIVGQYAYFAQPTHARDTLYLLENNTMSDITYNAWQIDSIVKKPAIVFVSAENMKSIKRRFNGSSN